MSYKAVWDETGYVRDYRRVMKAKGGYYRKCSILNRRWQRWSKAKRMRSWWLEPVNLEAI
jgi:hypothetical protein